MLYLKRTGSNMKDTIWNGLKWEKLSSDCNTSYTHIERATHIEGTYTHIERTHTLPGGGGGAFFFLAPSGRSIDCDREFSFFLALSSGNVWLDPVSRLSIPGRTFRLGEDMSCIPLSPLCLFLALDARSEEIWSSKFSSILAVSGDSAPLRVSSWYPLESELFLEWNLWASCWLDGVISGIRESACRGVVCLLSTVISAVTTFELGGAFTCCGGGGARFFFPDLTGGPAVGTSFTEFKAGADFTCTEGPLRPLMSNSLDEAGIVFCPFTATSAVDVTYMDLGRSIASVFRRMAGGLPPSFRVLEDDRDFPAWLRSPCMDWNKKLYSLLTIKLCHILPHQWISKNISSFCKDFSG